MKKILATIALASLAAASTYAQGFVVFASSTQAQSTNNVTGGEVISDSALGNATVGKTTLASANNFYYALFFSASQATTVNGSATAHQGLAAEALALGSVSGWAFSGDYAGSTTAGTGGRFSALNPNTDGSSTVQGLAGGGSATFVILGWSASLGSTLSALQASLLAGNVHGFLGQSAVSGVLTAGDGSSVTPPGIMGGAAPSIQAFTLGAVPVPEPATMVLAGLGGLSLLAFRRKK